MYQTRSIRYRYEKTNRKKQIIIPSNEVLATLVENLKWIMIGKLKNNTVSKLKKLTSQKINIWEEHFKIFQEIWVEESEFRKIMYAKHHPKILCEIV